MVQTLYSEISGLRFLAFVIGEFENLGNMWDNSVQWCVKRNEQTRVKKLVQEKPPANRSKVMSIRWRWLRSAYAATSFVVVCNATCRPCCIKLGPFLSLYKIRLFTSYQERFRAFEPKEIFEHYLKSFPVCYIWWPQIATSIHGLSNIQYSSNTVR